MIKGYSKKIYLKSLIFIFILIGIIVGYVFILNFYNKKIVLKINELNLVRQKQITYQKNLIQQTEFKKINNLIKQKTNQEPSYFLSKINPKLNLTFEDTKKLVLDEISKNNWQIKNSSSLPQELRIVFELRKEEIDKLFDFLLSNLMLKFLGSIKIQKNNEINDIYNIELDLRQNF